MVYHLEEEEYSIFCHCTGLLAAADKKKGRSYLNTESPAQVLKDFGKALRLFSLYLGRQRDKKVMAFLLQSLWNALVLRIDDFLIESEKKAREQRERAVQQIVNDNRDAAKQIEELSSQLAGIHRSYDGQIKQLEFRLAEI